MGPLLKVGSQRMIVGRYRRHLAIRGWQLSVGPRQGTAASDPVNSEIGNVGCLLHFFGIFESVKGS